MNTEQAITAEESAALVLLKSTGWGVLEAAQLAATMITHLRESTGRKQPSDATLTHYLQIFDYGIKAEQAREQTVSFEEAGQASVVARADCRPTTKRDLRYYLRRMLKVPAVAQLPLRSITTRQCRELLQAAFGHSKSTYIKGRAMLHSIFAYGIRQEWCDVNPVSRIEVPKVKEHPKQPLSLEKVQHLLQMAEKPEHRDMRFSLHLMLFNGIRPVEVSRLTPEDFNYEEKLLIIRPQKSKTGGGRAVPLRGLNKLPRNEWHIPPNWQRRWRALRNAAGFSVWIPDVCRHTFASYHAAHFRNLAELQMEMGHRDSSLLRMRYTSPVASTVAKHFWNLI